MSVMGAAAVKGIQDLRGDGGIPHRAAACMKHFIGYGDPVNGTKQVLSIPNDNKHCYNTQ